MTSLIRPLDIFTKTAFKSSCVWLDAYTSHTGERPCWQWLWNRAENRITNEDGAMRIVDRVRMSKLRAPSVICGEVSRFDKQAKKFYSEQQCQFASGSDEERPNLSVCLEQIGKAAPLTGTGIGPPPTLILGGLSGRLDRMMATLDSLVPKQAIYGSQSASSTAAPSYILDGENLVCILPKGQHHLAVGPRTHLTDICGLVPICQTETRVTTRGLRWNLENAPLSFGGGISTSNELINDEIEITTTAPVIFSMELLASITCMDKPHEFKTE